MVELDYGYTLTTLTIKTYMRLMSDSLIVRHFGVDFTHMRAKLIMVIMAAQVIRIKKIFM